MTDNSHKPVDSSDGKARPTTVPDPNRKYVPSGRSTSKTLQTYLWFSIIAIFAIQIPVYVTSFLSISIIPIVFSMSDHINMNRGLGLSIVVWGIFAFLVGYFFTGLMLGKFIRIGTERSHCRNRRMEVLAIIGTLVAAFCLKVCIVYYISKTHTKAQNVNVFDLPIRFWVEMVFSWGIIALGSLVKKMRPYCEECENYMVKKQYNFMPSELDSLLSGISSCDLELLRKCKRTDSHYPSVELQIHTCDNLHSGYIEVSLNTETADEKGSKSKSSKTVYSDHMSSGAVGVWCRAMGQAPINVASRQN